MSIYLQAFVMLSATIAAFVCLAKLVQAVRMRRFSGYPQAPTAVSGLAIEQTYMIDGKRRLLLIRCDEQRVLLLTGGPADLVIGVLPPRQLADAAA